ncbi:MAG: hypothetical protein AAFY41_00665 [Bacteroidota bacterium]
MKKNILVLSVSIIVAFSSCSDDDGSGSFVGVWIGNNITTTNCSDDEDNDSETLRCGDTCYRLELNSDDTFSYQEVLATRSGTWSTSGGLTLCVEEEGEEICETYIVALTSTTLAITDSTSSSGCTTTINFQRELETDVTN